jgi:predicted ATPase
MQQKIVLIGGPSSGKTTIINALLKKGYGCMTEVSRAVIVKAKEEGITQLFLTDPLLFSNLLLEGREKQYQEAEALENKIIFFDRGIPDIHAYLNFVKTEYPSYFIDKSNAYKYTKIFHFPPWKEIYTTDSERYESFEESEVIDTYLTKAYLELGYPLIQVPFGSVMERTAFILNAISQE